jgi:hypothetical protein
VGGGVVEAHRDPAAERYRHQERVGRGGALAPAAFPDVALEVADFLG